MFLPSVRFYSSNVYKINSVTKIGIMQELIVSATGGQYLLFYEESANESVVSATALNGRRSAGFGSILGASTAKP